MSAAQQTAAMLLDGSETAKEFIHRARGWQGVVAANGFTKVRMPDELSRMYQKDYYTADAYVVLTLDAPTNRYAAIYFTVVVIRLSPRKQLFAKDYRISPANVSRVVSAFEVLIASNKGTASLIKMIKFLMGNNSLKDARR